MRNIGKTPRFRAQLYILKHVDNFDAQSEKLDAIWSIIGRFGLLIMPFSSYLSYKVC